MASNAQRRNLQRLLSPRHICAVGGWEAESVIEQTRKFGFNGPIWPVNPRRDSMAGLPCYASVADLPQAPDICFLAIPREATIDTLGQLAAMGAGGVICYASGFAEVPGGQVFQDRLAEAAGELAVVGPNCYGIVNGLHRYALWPDQHGVYPMDRGVAFVSQSGNMAITFTMQERELPLAAALSVGNQAVLKVHDYIAGLAEDPRIAGIGLYIEAIEDPTAFAAAALKCAECRIPIVALKAGRTSEARRTALSHTSALAGSSDALIDAFFRRYGVLRVETLSELAETLKLLAFHGPLAGPNIATLSCSGGDAAVMADLAVPRGLQFPAFPAANQSKLEAVLGPKVTVANPLDFHTYIWANLEAQKDCFAGVLSAGLDACLLMIDYPRLGENDIKDWDISLEAWIKAVAETGGKGMVLSTLPEGLPRPARRRLAELGIAPMQGALDCVKALAATAQLGEAWRRFEGEPPPLPWPLTPEETAGEACQLDEVEAKSLLANHGLRVPKGRKVTIDAAAGAARELGFPVVVKTAASIAHKTEAGGVALALKDGHAVSEAAAAMAKLGNDVLVEEMLPKPLVELILGAAIDQELGPYLLLGAGGVFVELLQDTVSILLPTSEAEVREALLGLRVAPLLQGYRGQAAADVDAVVSTVMALGKLIASEKDRFLELDINPLMVYAEPATPVAADALIRLRKGKTPDRT